MILLKLGRRVSAFALSVLLLSVSVFPAFATSTSGQLQEVGWSETVSSFLMASGIYPFESDAETGYEEWSVSSLKALWDEFRDDTTQVAYDIVDLTGNLVKGVIAIASGRWSVLREFATWIVNKYNVTDNQTGVELGVNQVSLPVLSSLPSGQSASSYLSTNGLDSGRYKNVNVRLKAVTYVGDSGETIYLRAYVYDSRYSAWRAVFAAKTSFGLYFINEGGGITSTSAGPVSSAPGWYDVIAPNGSGGGGLLLSSFVLGVPVYNSLDEFNTALNGGLPVDFVGVTADTTTVSIPAALPSGTDFGGLVVSGTGVAVTPEQLEEIVQNAVKEALKPSVAVVPVALSPDVNVSPSGEITLSGDVTIDTGNIPLQPSDYSAPNLSKVFPFSIPWDVLAVLNVLDAEPVRPEFNVDLYIPVLDVHVPWTIGVSEALQEPVDNFMASMRLLLLVAMCAGTLWLFWRSNL